MRLLSACAASIPRSRRLLLLRRLPLLRRLLLLHSFDDCRPSGCAPAGELSVYARETTVLTKSIRPLPDKWSGLTDVNKRYRNRHVDMIVNPEVRAPPPHPS